MKRLHLFFAFILSAVVGGLGCGEQNSPLATAQDDGTPALTKAAVAAGRYIVVLQDGVSDVPRVAGTLASAHGAIPEHVYQHALKGFSVTLPAQAAAALAADPQVKYIEPDQIATIVGGVTPNKGKPPGGGGGGGGGTPPSEVTPWGITRVGGGVDGTGKTAWVIDTGIDLAHADLNVDVGRSVSYVSRGKNTPQDGHGHGTHVAGTIAAVDNDIDVIGVAAGATVVAVRVLDNRGSGSYSGVIAGVDYVADNAASGDVANMSLGGPPSQALDDAVIAASNMGINFVLAAGNESDDANNHSPARANGDNIYTISAIADGDGFASFSNYGNPPIDFAAPGVNVLSTKLGGGTIAYNGTSMAAPHVAGILLLGSISRYDFAVGDPDGNPDPIAEYTAP
jgi:subtilisin family serine protease